MVLPHMQPTRDVVSPRSEFSIEIGPQEAWDKCFHGILLGYVSGFHIVVIIRHTYIPGIADDVDNSLVSRLEALVAFQNAGPGQAPHHVVRIEINLRNAPLDVTESDRIILVEQ